MDREPARRRSVVSTSSSDSHHAMDRPARRRSVVSTSSSDSHRVSERPARVRRMSTEGIDKSSAFEEVKRVNQLEDWGKKILEKTELNSLFELVMDELKNVLHADRCTLFVADRSKQELWSKVAQGTVEIRLKFGEGLAGACAASGEIVNVEDAYFDKRFNDAFDRKNSYRTKAVLCAPVLDPKTTRLLGVTQVINKNASGGEPPYFTKNDEKVISSLCGHVARAIEQCIAAESGGKVFMAMAAAAAFAKKPSGTVTALLGRGPRSSIKMRMMQVASLLHKIATYDPCGQDILKPIHELTSMFQACSSVSESNLIATQLLQPDILRSLRRAARSGSLHAYVSLRLLNFLRFHPSAPEALANLELIPVLVGILAADKTPAHLPAILLLESLSSRRDGVVKVARFGGTHVLVRLLEGGDSCLRPICLRLLSALLTTERGREDIVDGQAGRKTLQMILHGYRDAVDSSMAELTMTERSPVRDRTGKTCASASDRVKEWAPRSHVAQPALSSSKGSERASPTASPRQQGASARGERLWRRGTTKVKMVSNFSLEESALARQIAREVNMWEKTIKTQLQATGSHKTENTIQSNFQRLGFKY